MEFAPVNKKLTYTFLLSTRLRLLQVNLVSRLRIVDLYTSGVFLFRFSSGFSVRLLVLGDGHRFSTLYLFQITRRVLPPLVSKHPQVHL